MRTCIIKYTMNSTKNGIRIILNTVNLFGRFSFIGLHSSFQSVNTA